MAHDAFDLPAVFLDELTQTAGQLGAQVDKIYDEPEGGRFIGTFEGTRITLYPKYDSNLALYFTVAHLYGHMVQAVAPGANMQRAVALVQRQRQVLTNEEVQCVYDHEREAAEIGRTLLSRAHSVSPALDSQYTRIFLADFHYLVNFLETGEAGAALFDRYWRRQPIPESLLREDPRPLVDLRVVGSQSRASAIVV